MQVSSVKYPFVSWIQEIMDWIMPVSRRISPVWPETIVVAAGCLSSKIGFRRYSRQPPFVVAQYSGYIPEAARKALSIGPCRTWDMLLYQHRLF